MLSDVSKAVPARDLIQSLSRSRVHQKEEEALS